MEILIIAVIALVVVAGVGAAVYIFISKGKEKRVLEGDKGLSDTTMGIGSMGGALNQPPTQDASPLFDDNPSQYQPQQPEIEEVPLAQEPTFQEPVASAPVMNDIVSSDSELTPPLPPTPPETPQEQSTDLLQGEQPLEIPQEETFTPVQEDSFQIPVESTVESQTSGVDVSAADMQESVEETPITQEQPEGTEPESFSVPIQTEDQPVPPAEIPAQPETEALNVPVQTEEQTTPPQEQESGAVTPVVEERSTENAQGEVSVPVSNMDTPEIPDFPAQQPTSQATETIPEDVPSPETQETVVTQPENTPPVTEPAVEETISTETQQPAQEVPVMPQPATIVESPENVPEVAPENDLTVPATESPVADVTPAPVGELTDVQRSLNNSPAIETEQTEQTPPPNEMSI